MKRDWSCASKSLKFLKSLKVVKSCKVANSRKGSDSRLLGSFVLYMNCKKFQTSLNLIMAI